MAWLFFLYPISLACSKTCNDGVVIFILLTACVALIKHRTGISARIERHDWWWIGALCLPSLIALLQHFLLTPPLPPRDLEDSSRFLVCIPVFLALSILRPNIRPFLWGCVCFVLYTAPLMFRHLYLLHLDRGIAPNGFLSIIPHSSLVVILGVLTTHLWIGSHALKRHVLLISLVLLVALSVPFITQTRTALLVILLLYIFIWTLLPSKNLKRLSLLAACAAAAIAYALVYSALWTRTDRTVNEIETYTTGKTFQSTSTTTRIELWRFGVKMFIEHPLIGVGRHRYFQELKQYQQDGVAPVNLELHTHPHNELLHFASEQGVAGMLSYLLLYAGPLCIAWRSYRKRPHIAHPAFLALVFVTGFLMAGLTDVMLAWKASITFYGFVVSLLLVWAGQKKIDLKG